MTNYSLADTDIWLLKVSEVEDILNISRSMVYKLISEKELPVIRLGRSIRIRFKDVEMLLNKNRIG